MQVDLGVLYSYFKHYKCYAIEKTMKWYWNTEIKKYPRNQKFYIHLKHLSEMKDKGMFRQKLREIVASTSTKMLNKFFMQKNMIPGSYLDICKNLWKNRGKESEKHCQE